MGRRVGPVGRDDDRDRGVEGDDEVAVEIEPGHLFVDVLDGNRLVAVHGRPVGAAEVPGDVEEAFVLEKMESWSGIGLAEVGTGRRISYEFALEMERRQRWRRMPLLSDTAKHGHDCWAGGRAPVVFHNRPSRRDPCAVHPSYQHIVRTSPSVVDSPRKGQRT